jgi:hypothetical protein
MDPKFAVDLHNTAKSQVLQALKDERHVGYAAYATSHHQAPWPDNVGRAALKGLLEGMVQENLIDCAFDEEVPLDDSERKKWFDRLLDWAQCGTFDVVFVDPNTGIAPPTPPKNADPRNYVTAEELQGLSQHKDVLVYQHLPGPSSYRLAESKARELATHVRNRYSKAGLDATIWALPQNQPQAEADTHSPAPQVCRAVVVAIPKAKAKDESWNTLDLPGQWRQLAGPDDAVTPGLELPPPEGGEDSRQRIAYLEQALACEARIVEAQVLDLKSLSGSRRRVLTESVAAMRRVAVGGTDSRYFGRSTEREMRALHEAAQRT